MSPGDADALVTTDWLAGHLNDPSLWILDASYFVPGGIAPALAQFNDAHIPGAIFFDINAVADPTKPKDHAFPDAATFAAKIGALGVGNDHHVVAYDHLGGTCAAARVWFMFRAFGHTKVSVLDGGRRKWSAGDRPFSREIPRREAQTYRATDPRPHVRETEQILANIGVQNFQVLDARGKGRFEGNEPEPRPGLRSGHIPRSHNLPFLELLDPATHTWKKAAAIAGAFADAGIDLARPLTTTCGSGVTACALALGAYLVGKTDATIYDGSWFEWGADPSLPLETGAHSAPSHPSTRTLS